MRSSPRNSTLVPAITLSSQSELRAHSFGPRMKVSCEVASSGSSRMSQSSVLRKNATLKRNDRTRSMAGPHSADGAPAGPV
jgi:hypothetical protein